MIRLQKYMAQCGIGSRRKCEDIIREGHVLVNGAKIVDMGVKIDPENDEVTVNGKPAQPESNKVYILLNKPSGVITTINDPYNRTTVIDHIGWKKNRIFPIGRLDYDTEGLLIMTNDGELAFHMTHPRHEIEKEYTVIIEGVPSSQSINKLRRGVDIGGYVTSPANINKIKQDMKGRTQIEIIISEGKNRQIRRMFGAIGHRVQFLRRDRIAFIKLGKLKTGEWRHLTPDEVSQLKKLNVGG